MRLAKIEKELEKVELIRQELKAAQAEALGKRFVTCTNNCFGKGCGKRTQVRNLIYIQTHFYISPHGCTGGDYWKPGEGQFDCPKCDHRNRLYDRPEIMELNRYFESIEDVHEH